jgi:HEXXH motif-containing protein
VSLSTLITAYLQQPFRVCNAPLATALAEAGQQRLLTTNGLAAEQYSIANCLYPATALGDSPITLELGDKLPLIELPELLRLGGFYEEHGLEPLPYDELLASQASAKLQAAWHLLASVPTVQAGMRALIKTIHVLRSPDPEIDISYSHPTVPFSVFVTVGEDCSTISSLRVVESLLHEAMHLKLTLIEQEVALVQPTSQSLFYSPWRDELRPVRGVLHGIFVFAAVREFYQQIRQHVGASPAATFVTDRIESITQELELVCNFTETPDLTDAGQVLACSLLSLEKALESH